MPLPNGHHVHVLLSCRAGRTVSDQVLVRHIRSTASTFETNQKVPEEKKVVDKPSKLLENFEPSNLTKERVFENARAAYALASKTANDFYIQKKVQIFGPRKQEDVEWYSARVSFWMKRYENFVGLTEVKEAQVRVVKTEKTFVQTQEARRESQRLLNEVQQKIKDVHTELERTNRGEDKYLELITLEHHFLKEEKSLHDKLAAQEREEREMFSKLSRAVRDSHESERAQAEKTKYWSVLGSVIGTCLGVIGTTINNRLRMRELRELVTESTSNKVVVPMASKSGPSLESSETIGRLSDKIDEVTTSSSKYFGELSKAVASLAENMESSLKQVADSTNEITAIPLSRSDLTLLFEGQDARLNKLQEQLNGLQTTSVDKSIKTSLQELKHKLDQKVEKDIEKERTFNINIGKSNLVLDNMDKKVADVEEKLKDVRSLLLSQVFTEQSKLPDTRGAAKKKETAEVVERTQKTIVGAVEVALKEHEQRINSTMIVNSLVVAVLTPLVAYAVSKII